MKENRPLSVLYSILYKNCDKKRLKLVGICSEINRMVDQGANVTQSEEDRLKLHFLTQRPSKTKHKEFFYKNKSTLGETSAYWWKCERQFSEGYYDDEIVDCPKTIRSKFIRHLIQVCKDEERNSLFM